MLGLPSVANPWVLLGLLLALLAAFFGGEHRGLGSGRAEVQAAWDRDSARRALLASENAQRSRDTEQNLQASRDAERMRNADTLARMDARLSALTGELRKRPARPAAAAGADTQAAGAGPDGGGTGAGLYRDDALFLAGKADLWQRIRLQRDECYAAYGAADRALRELNARQAASPR